MTKNLIVIALIVIAALLTVIFLFSSPPRAEPLRIATIGPYNLLYIDTAGTIETARELVGIVRAYSQDSMSVEIISSFMMVLDTAFKSTDDTVHFRAGVAASSFPETLTVPIDTATYRQTRAIVSELPLVDFLARIADPFSFRARARSFAEENDVVLSDHLLEIADRQKGIVTLAAPLRE